MTAHCDRLNCFKYDLKADIKFVYKTFSNGLPFSKSGPVRKVDPLLAPCQGSRDFAQTYQANLFSSIIIDYFI